MPINNQQRDKLKQLGMAVVNTEAEAIAGLRHHINDNFAHACQLMLACEGKVVVIGMGKSGHIGSKIAAPAREPQHFSFTQVKPAMATSG